MRLAPGLHRILTGLAVIIFLGGIFYSFGQIEGSDFNIISVQAFCLLFLSVPLMLHLSVRRFQVVTEIYTERYPYYRAAQTVVYGALANILPIPGAFIVRVASIANRVGMKKALYCNVLAYLVWISVSALFAVLLYLSVLWVAFSLFFIFICYLFLFFFINRTLGHTRTLPALFGFQALLTASNIVRIFLISYCLGSVIGLDTASLIQLSGVVVSGTGLVPAGLGLAEAAAATLTSMTGDLAAVGFAVVAVNRILTWIGLLAAVCFIRRPKVAAE
ncbi:MAG: hypothetical protein ACJATD_000558 [Alloalcanivorax sp.]|jgi:hypothetical protein